MMFLCLLSATVYKNTHESFLDQTGREKVSCKCNRNLKIMCSENKSQKEENVSGPPSGKTA